MTFGRKVTIYIFVDGRDRQESYDRSVVDGSHIDRHHLRRFHGGDGEFPQSFAVMTSVSIPPVTYARCSELKFKSPW